MQPQVSIIIPTFNSQKFLQETLESVVAQTYSNWDCLLVDDGSTDSTIEILKSYSKKDSRFQVFKRPAQLPKGPSSARNFGISQAKGDYLIFLDSDDLLSTRCLENRITQFAQNQDCDFLVFQMERFLDLPDFSKTFVKTELDKNKILESFINLHGQWPITSPIYKTTFFTTIGFNSELIVFEDLEVAIKAIVKANNFEIYSSIDCFYRNDANYQSKYNSLTVKFKIIKAFHVLVRSLAILMLQNSEHRFKNDTIRSFGVQSYKKLFRFEILENSKAFKKENKKILHLLADHGFLDTKTAFKFYLTDLVLLPFANIKGSGVARLIKKIYN